MNLPARRSVAVNPLRRLFDRKAISGQGVGWNSYGSSFPGRSPLPRTITDWLATYGGTDDSISWVYSCVSLISSEGAAYTYEVIQEDGEALAVEDIPDDLKLLLDHPNSHMTYYDFAQYIFMDLELAGNSYWLKDQPNGYGQPEELLRLRPDLVQIAVNARDEIIGYIYTVKGIPIPFDAAEIIHVRYPNPYDEKYGMGTVEAIQRSLNSDLAASEHVTGFYSEGGRISGILTVSDTMSEIQFERLRQEFETGFKASKSFGILLAESGTGYSPLTQAPAASGITEIRSMNKDEILSAFGVPAFLLGGVGQGGLYKMSEAQHIFSRAMVPRARRFGERITHDLVALWGLELRLDVTVTESTEDKLSHARELNGIGASLNEIRDAAGLPPIDDAQADEPLVNQGIMPFSLAIKQVEANLPPDASGGMGGLGGGASFAQPYDSGQGSAGVDSFMSGNGGGGPNQIGPTGGGDNFTPGDSYVPDFQYSTMAAPRPKSRHPLAPRVERKTIKEPDKPDGFEKLGTVHLKYADRETAQAILDVQAKVLKKGVPLLEKAFAQFFAEQRKRLISRLPSSVTSEKAVGNYSTKRINLSNLWRPDEEAKALVEIYLKAIDILGEIAMDVGNIVGAAVDWTVTNPYVAEVRDQLATEIKQINETTREGVANVIDEGVRRGYSVPQIANGFPAESYKGISGVFDAADAARSETIARTETAKLFNNAALLSYEAAGITHVEVMDGNYDAICEAANGQRWTLAEAADKPIAHPNAVFAGTEILPLGKVQGAYRAWWSGPCMRVRTAAGSQLAVGPNHPVLTSRGWVKAESLRQGDDVVRCSSEEFSMTASGEDLNKRPLLAEEVFEALVASASSWDRVSAAPDQFHGDGNFCQGEVDVVWADGPLSDVAHIAAVEVKSEEILNGTRVKHPFFSGPSSRLSGGDAVFGSTASSMGGVNMGAVGVAAPEDDASLAQPLSDAALANPEFLAELQRRYAFSVSLDEVVGVVDGPSPSRAHGHSGLLQASVDGRGPDAEFLGDVSYGLPGHVALDKVVSVEIEAFHGWAYDFQVEGRAYFADEVLATNCIRSFAPIVDTNKGVKKRRVTAALPAAGMPGVPDPNFRESNIRRDPGGRFADKPDVSVSPTPDQPVPEQPKAEPAKVKAGSSAYLTQIGVPPEVIREIERIGLDKPLKNRKGEVAKRLLGSFEDTKEKFTNKKTGAYSAERKKLHDHIIDLMLRQKKPVYDAEHGRVNWVLDPEGAYIDRPEEMKKQTMSKITELSQQLSDVNPQNEEAQARTRAELQAWQDQLARLEDGRKRVLFLAGGNASGKSTALYSEENKSALKPDGATLEINFDLIKEQIPEFQEMAAAHDIYGTDGTHFESQDIAKRLMEEGKSRGLNIVVDASGDSSKPGFIDTIKAIKDEGYETEVLMVDAPLQDAVTDMLKRAFRSGRYVPTPVMAQIHKNSVARFLEWKESTAIDRYTVYRRHGSDLIQTSSGGQGRHVVDSKSEFAALESKAEGGIQPDATQQDTGTTEQLVPAQPVDGGKPSSGRRG